CKYTPGAYRPLANKDNDYLIDRAAQKAGKTFSGVAGFAMQDASLQESMGPICDRTKENLVSTDNGIIMARHRLMRAAKALAEKGVTPPGVDPAHHKVRSASVVLPPDQAFKDADKEALTAGPGVPQTGVRGCLPRCRPRKSGAQKPPPLEYGSPPPRGRRHLKSNDPR